MIQRFGMPYLFLTALFVTVQLPLSLEAQQIRSLTGVAFETYFDDTRALHLEEVLIVPVVPGRLQLQGAIRYEWDNTTGSDRSLTRVQTGPILIFGPHLYGSLLYGIGIRDSGDLLHDGDLRLTYEQARYVLSAGARARWEPEEGSAYVVPSLGARVVFARRLGVQATYFLGYNSDEEVSHALWSEVDYQFTPRITAKIGGSIALGDGSLGNGSPGADEERDYTLIGGLRFAFSELIALRYQLDYIGRADSADGIGNGLYLDWRF